MRNLRGILVAAVFALLTLILVWVADQFDILMGMAYPFMSKTALELVGAWTSRFTFNLWQVAIAVYGVVVLATLGLAILFRWNLLRWLGAVLVPVSIAIFLNTGLWGLNYYTKPIGEGMKLEVSEYTVSDLKEAAIYYRDQAVALADLVPRDENGNLQVGDLAQLNAVTAQSYDDLVWKYSIFAGSRGPIKELGWSEMLSRFGIDGVTVGLTGEAAINLNQSSATLPFKMCREMAKLLAFAREDEANFAAYLACEHSRDIAFRYSGYLNAFQYCSNALYDTSKSAWREVWDGVSDTIYHDVNDINAYVAATEGETKVQIQAVYDEMLKALNEEKSIDAYGEVTDLLVAWYIDQYRPVEEVEENAFDPTDYDQVFPTVPPEETTEGTEATEEG